MAERGDRLFELRDTLGEGDERRWIGGGAAARRLTECRDRLAKLGHRLVEITETGLDTRRGVRVVLGALGDIGLQRIERAAER
ncbi:hypothetical protein G5V57_09945 [Nordella sp. HKS 07]|uniref:hypothetical protein n=1 Tax=Nordella sp. HKS 07 TaxID=2712222 RepID=UPI0013E1C55A|nr:hypothetical protein [Nordella sp. HKS 07]QIG48014.1 hypothetical protein G5V57_09945 [Nordella sp. HKS 07]